MKFIEKFRNQKGRTGKFAYKLTLCLVCEITISVRQNSCIFSALHYIALTCLDGQYLSRKRYNILKKR